MSFKKFFTKMKFYLESYVAVSIVKKKNSPKEITEWIKEPKGHETSICPKCGIDSVLSSELPITTEEFLDRMNKF